MGVEQETDQASHQAGALVTRRQFLEVIKDVLSMTAILPLLSLRPIDPPQRPPVASGGQLEPENPRIIEGPPYDITNLTYLLPHPFGPDESWPDVAGRLSVRDIRPSDKQALDNFLSLITVLNPAFHANLSRLPHNPEDYIESSQWLEWDVPNTNFQIVSTVRNRDGVGSVGVLHAYDMEGTRPVLAQSFLMVLKDPGMTGFNRERDSQTLRGELDQMLHVPYTKFHPVELTGESIAIDFSDGSVTKHPVKYQGLIGNLITPDGRELDILTQDGFPPVAIVLITEPNYPKRLFIETQSREDVASSFNASSFYPFARMVTSLSLA